MKTPRDTTRVVMERPDLEGIPRFPLDVRFQIRPWEPGDGARWLAIHREADPPFADHGCYEKQFGTDPAVLEARQLYLCDREDVIGTASAWHEPSYKDGTWGRVHWVAILPAYQGRGLAKPLLAQVMQTMAVLGHRQVYLTTQRFRRAAIGLYTSFGFAEI